MTDRELHKLRRDDLLQILISQQKRIDELTARLEESERAREDRSIAVSESGSIAEAALKLNDVFAAAQQAADDYVAQVMARGDELRAKMEREAAEAHRTSMEEMRLARAEADQLEAQAQADSDRIRAEAEQELTRARAERERLEALGIDTEARADEGENKKRFQLPWKGRRT